MPACERHQRAACSGSSQVEKATAGLPCLRRLKRSSSEAARTWPPTTTAASLSWNTAFTPRIFATWRRGTRVGHRKTSLVRRRERAAWASRYHRSGRRGLQCLGFPYRHRSTQLERVSTSGLLPQPGRESMSHLRCPSCGLRVRAIGAPLHSPLCAAHGRGHPELGAAPMFAPAPPRPMRSVRTPPPPVFRLHERELGRGLTEVAVEGELDLATTDRLQAALEPAERRGHRRRTHAPGRQIL